MFSFCVSPKDIEVGLTFLDVTLLYGGVVQVCGVASISFGGDRQVKRVSGGTWRQCYGTNISR